MNKEIENLTQLKETVNERIIKIEVLVEEAGTTLDQLYECRSNLDSSIEILSTATSFEKASFFEGEAVLETAGIKLNLDGIDPKDLPRVNEHLNAVIEKIKKDDLLLKPDAKPVEVKPVEAKSVEVKPVEVKPVEAKPVEAKPELTGESDPQNIRQPNYEKIVLSLADFEPYILNNGAMTEAGSRATITDASNASWRISDFSPYRNNIKQTGVTMIIGGYVSKGTFYAVRHNSEVYSAFPIIAGQHQVSWAKKNSA